MKSLFADRHEIRLKHGTKNGLYNFTKNVIIKRFKNRKKQKNKVAR